MEFKKDLRIYEKFFEPISEEFERNLDLIYEIVLHGTAGGRTASGMLRWMLTGERAKEYRRGVALYHDLLDRNGDVYAIIPYHYWVYHSSSGKHDKRTIGIEMINPEKDNDSEYTNEQYEGLFKHIEYLLSVIPSIKSIVGHGSNKLKYSGKYKECPGNFDWDRLQKHFSLKKVEQERYSWIG